MSSSDQRSGEPQSIASMRVRLKYADVETFIERFGANVTRNGIFIATKSVKPPGTLVRFELQLSDGTKLLKGEGVVAWKRESDSPEAQVPGRPPGMGLRFSKLDADSRKLLERIAAFKAEHGEADGGGVPNAPLGGAESGPVMALGIDSGPVSALERTPLPERTPAPAAAGSSPSLTAMPMPTTYEPGGDTDMRSLEELRALIDEDEGAFDEVLERARRIAKDTHNGAAAGDDDTLKALDELLQSRGDPGADATVESATQALAGLLGAKAPARVHQRGPHAWAEPAPPRAPVAAPPVAAEPVAAEPPAAAEPAIMTSALPAPAIVPEAAPFDELPPAATSSPATRRPLTSPSAGAST